MVRAAALCAALHYILMDPGSKMSLFGIKSPDELLFNDLNSLVLCFVLTLNDLLFKHQVCMFNDQGLIAGMHGRVRSNSATENRECSDVKKECMEEVGYYWYWPFAGQNSQHSMVRL